MLRGLGLAAGICLLLTSASLLCAQDSAGARVFENRCSGCHGSDGNGGELGPNITLRLRRLTDEQVRNTILHGIPGRMPANDVGATEMPQLIAFIRALRPHLTGFQPYQFSAKLSGGTTLKGLVLNESFDDVQLRTDDNRVHLLRKLPGGGFRAVTSEVDWPTYNGDIGGNRYAKLTQIDRSNVRRVAPRWAFTIPGAFSLQGTPVVADGVMYVTNGNECYALDAGSGRTIWHYHQERTQGVVGGGAGGINRGVALSLDKVFMVTDTAHLIAINRGTGELEWDTEIADWHKNYSATSAPLTVGNLVISGTAGGEEGARGLIAAFDQETGKEVWRFWAVPSAGQPGSETWKGKGIEHGGAVAWFTGVYDAETDTLIWQTGNPGEDYNGDERGGDDLYSDCLLALDPKTGKLKWYFQTTPHDLWDWDATESPLVIDTNWQGEPRKLLVQGNRNGFFYVLDRTNGKLLLAKPFIRELTWAKGMDRNGKPIPVPGQEPSEEGTRVCPSQDGATNWFSPSYNPQAGLFYLQAMEKCSVYTKHSEDFQLGREFLGGAQRIDFSKKPLRILRALDVQTGAVKWEVPQVGNADSWGGTLATASGLVFFCEDSGAFAAADSVTGEVLWSFQTNASWHASPMAYQFDGKELIGVAAGPTILVFGLVD